MILIKLSSHHKIVGIVIAALLMVLSLLFTTGAVSVNSNYTAKDECATTTNDSAEGTTTETDVVDVTTPVVEETETKSEEELVEENLYTQYYTEQDALDIAKVLYHECRGVPSKTEQACVAWTVLNRVDKDNSTVYSVVRAPHQFAFYEDAPVRDELLDLAYDVLERWNREKNGETDVGRVLPEEYIFFYGRDGRNHFRDNYKGSYNIWDYSLDSPYEN